MSKEEKSTDPANPYNARDHESQLSLDREDVLAVAGLLGSVSRNLSDIDSKNVGGSNQFTQAKKIDPKAVLKEMTATSNIQPSRPPPPILPDLPEQVQRVNMNQVPDPLAYDPNIEDIIKRIEALESALDKSNKAFKFKRGISYDINTASIKGNFKSPNDIIDIILTELAKNTKTITLKLNDSNKNRK